jgi:hypothetical protein
MSDPPETGFGGDMDWKVLDLLLPPDRAQDSLKNQTRLDCKGRTATGRA